MKKEESSSWGWAVQIGAGILGIAIAKLLGLAGVAAVLTIWWAASLIVKKNA